jgi:FMN phosphatase YigB (HAD superfamily)
MTILIDIDGTLVDKDDNPRPFIDKLLDTINANDYVALLWSGGGIYYARDKARRLGIEKKIIGIVPKTTETMSKMLIDPKEYYVIDDSQDLIDAMETAGCRGFKVPFYESAMEDKHSENILLEVREDILQQSS